MAEQQKEIVVPLKPTGEQVKRIAQSDIEGPVVMLNLLRYEKTAKDENGAEGLSGRGSYERYGEEMREIMEKTGAKVVWRGRADSVVIGNDDADAWDMVLLVECRGRHSCR